MTATTKSALLMALLLSAGVLSAASGCGEATNKPRTAEGETHWLEVCGANADCDADYECLCGVCTQPCTDTCSGDARCVAATETSVELLCFNEAPAAVCLPECSSDSDCPDESHACLAGSCVPESKDACALPEDSGPCEAAITRYWHDSDTGVCRSFIYGGCEGNANNFESLEDCQSACDAAAPPTCELPADSGPCLAAMPRWFFSVESQTCEQFTYGGCGGNSNNFESFEACRGECGGGTPALCELPADVGPCDAAVPRWFFNADTSQCEEFTWGGCDGNLNNFETQQGCEGVCGA